MVYPVQRHLGRGRDPAAAQRRGHRVSAVVACPLALALPAGGVPRARHGVDHGGGGGVERLHRRRIPPGGRAAPHHGGPGEPDQRRHGPRQFSAAGGRDRLDEPDRGRLEPVRLAGARRLGPDPLRGGAMTPGPLLLEARHVTQRFRLPNGQVIEALRDVSLSVCEQEVVALVGPSGCGKSTLLRLFAGLARPADGSVQYRGRPLKGVLGAAAMVLQSFALLPWLTVAENVAMGLEARGVNGAARRDAVARAITLVGLDGVEQAYPKELSRGRRRSAPFRPGGRTSPRSPRSPATSGRGRTGRATCSSSPRTWAWTMTGCRPWCGGRSSSAA